MVRFVLTAHLPVFIRLCEFAHVTHEQHVGFPPGRWHATVLIQPLLVVLITRILQQQIGGFIHSLC